MYRWIVIGLLSLALAPASTMNKEAVRSELRTHRQHAETEDNEGLLQLAKSLLDVVDREWNEGMGWTQDLPKLKELMRSLDRILELLENVNFRYLSRRQFQLWKWLMNRQETLSSEIGNVIKHIERRGRSELRLKVSV